MEEQNYKKRLLEINNEKDEISHKIKSVNKDREELLDFYEAQRNFFRGLETLSNDSSFKNRIYQLEDEIISSQKQSLYKVDEYEEELHLLQKELYKKEDEVEEEYHAVKRLKEIEEEVHEYGN